MVDTTFAPYYDDYDETKGFHRILFKPKVGVQVRELNQLQTMMQKQIERFGSHIFENGSMVVPGESNYDYSYEYVTLSNVDYETVAEILLTNTVVLVGATTSVRATIVQHVANNTTDPVTVYVKYESSGTGGESRFTAGEAVTFTYGNTDFTQATVLATGQGSVFTIEAGIFYFNGDFILTEAQRVVLGKYTNKPSAVVGFRLTESIVTWTDDESLVDVGNKNAIGADRLKKVLSLEVHGLDEVFDRETFIELAQFEEGIYRKKVLNSTYSVLADTMARRTYDESGDYTVSAFNVRLREHLLNGNNEGLYPAPKGLEPKFAVGIEPGKAYVRGYEIENFATRYIDVDKARETGHLNNSSFTLSVGNYISVSSLNILPKSSTFQQITFYSGVPSSAGNIPAGTVLGTARVRYTEMSSAVVGQAFLFLFDVKSAAGTNDTSFIDNAKSIYAAGAPAMTALVQSELIDSVNHGLVFKMPVSNVKTLLTAGASDTSFSVIRQFVATADSSGVVILSAGTNESFAVPTPLNGAASYTIAGGSISKQIYNLAVLGGVPTGTTMTLNFGAEAAGLSVTINVEVIKQQAIHKAKTKTVAPALTKTPAQVVNRRVPLDKADVYKITSITENGVDKTSHYTLNRNITQEYYGVSYIELNTGEALPTQNLIINFEYFLHGSGDYFNVDSYSTISYNDIPTETINSAVVNMCDVVDFRPRINDAGTGFTGTGASVVEVPAQYTLMRCDIDHYLPRIDKVYVDSMGTFGVVQGVPGITPSEPTEPNNSMVLYKLIVPAYTRSVSDIQAIFINNRRYTMRDIGKLEDRIANIEYYTTLSLLENETNAMQIVDATTGLARFKNGFMTDSFTDYTVADNTNQDFKASIEDNLMRPELGIDFVELKLDANYSTSQKTGPLVTLPYTERLFISQMLASDTCNVNPYAVYRWNGTLTLNPSNDVWFDSLIVNQQSIGSTVGSWSDTSASTTFTMYNGGQATTTTDPNAWTNAHDQAGLATTSTTTNIVTVSSYVVTTQIGSSDIPYMRAREVEFTGKGMMPYSRAYAYFDDVNVTDYCKSGSQAYGAPMFVNADGEIEGVFLIPNTEALRFRTGTKQFTLIDDPDNVRELSLSYAGAKYSAKGTLNLFEQTVVTTVSVTQVTDVEVVPWDPLAQSFFVEQAGGVFVTSIELYFKTKDQAMPVSIQIRDMNNGFPGKNIIPYSTCTLNSSEVNVSNNGTISTKFTLEAPVYLGNGNEYCFVVMSNSNNYSAFIATMGQVSLTENVAIAKQPFIGVMFKSQNNSTWSEDQSSDIKFRINSAKFQTNTVTEAGLAFGTPSFYTLKNNPLTAVAGSNVVKAFIPNHGYFVGTKFGIGKVNAAPGIPLTEINIIQTVFEVIDPDYITFKVTTPATSTGTFGGAEVLTERSMAISVMQPIIQTLAFDQTNVSWRYRGTTGQSVNGTETPYLLAPELNITPGANNLLTVPHVIPNLSDAADKLTAPAALITASMVTFVDSVSPVIDLNRTGVIGIVNRINNPATLTETAAVGGNAYGRYMTKVIGLKNAASSLKVYIDANQPQESVITMMYRTGNTEAEVNDKTWSPMTAISTSTTTDPFVFKEFEYGKDGIPLFSFYQFKLVMTSTSSCKVPLFKRMRGIALGT